NGTPLVVDPATGESVAIARALRPDVALLHAQVADRRGALRFDDPYAEDLLARASARVVATAETIVERLDNPTLPGTMVECVAAAPGGAFPTSCHHAYRHSAAHLREYLAAARDGGTEGYVETYVTGIPDHEAFLAKVEYPGRAGAPSLREGPP